MAEDFPDYRFYKVEKVIEQVLKQNELQELLHFTRISTHWKVIIGDPLYRKTIPLRLLRGTLYVGVPDSAYSNQLRYFVPNILDLIASPEICGEGAVRKVVFKLTDIPKQREVTVEPVAGKKETVELSGADRLRVDKAAHKIQDSDLRKGFSRLMGKLVAR